MKDNNASEAHDDTTERYRSDGQPERSGVKKTNRYGRSRCIDIKSTNVMKQTELCAINDMLNGGYADDESFERNLTIC